MVWWLWSGIVVVVVVMVVTITVVTGSDVSGGGGCGDDGGLLGRSPIVVPHGPRTPANLHLDIHSFSTYAFSTAWRAGGRGDEYLPSPYISLLRTYVCSNSSQRRARVFYWGVKGPCKMSCLCTYKLYLFYFFFFASNWPPILFAHTV